MWPRSQPRGVAKPCGVLGPRHRISKGSHYWLYVSELREFKIIFTGSSTVFRRIARYVYFAGLDAELLEMAGILREVLWESDRDKSGDTQFMDFVIGHLSAH